MANVYFDRYESFKENGTIKPIPGIPIPVKATDKKITYELGKTRLDKISQSYYGNPYHGFLIMLANPQYGGLEFDIPDGAVIRVPFPFNETLEQYEDAVEMHLRLYGE